MMTGDLYDMVSSARRVLTMARLERQRFVSQVDYIKSSVSFICNS